ASERIAVALAVIVALTAVVAGGMRRTSRTNAVIVSIAVAGLAVFVAAGAPSALEGAAAHAGSWLGGGARGLLHATALMFVAFAGYGRIATLGEEVRDPGRSIPRAIGLSLIAP